MSLTGLIKTPTQIHLVGIGGVGMAGLARLLHELGHRVSGSDLVLGDSARRLMALGIPIREGHAAEHLPQDATCLMYTSATRPDNPERCEARRRGLLEVPRGLALAELFNGRAQRIAVGGTHGKTTTTSMLASICREAHEDAGWFIGAELQNDAVLARWGGAAAPFVIEADESDGTLAKYRARIAVITNMDFDHMEFFDSEAGFIACFQRFVDQAERVILPDGDGLHTRLTLSEDNVIRYSSGDAPAYALPLPGWHNQLNARAAAAAAAALGISDDQICRGLKSFWLPRRRFECLARSGGRAVISDYAHHPAELAAAMKQAAEAERAALRVIFQPHRYTRTRALLRDFPPALRGAREIILCPVYAASEDPLPGGSHLDLYQACVDYGLPKVRFVESLDDAWEAIRSDWPEEETLLVLGAGDVEQLAFRARDYLQTLP